MNIKKIITCVVGLSFFSLANHTMAQRKISLKAPQISDDDVIGGNVGIRPYRKGGINLGKQQLQETTIYHNYGHGGAGATLAYGTVKYVVDQFVDDKHQEDQIAILGAGYMGLITANLLADMGYQVTIYADLFPQQELQIETLCLTSLIAGGLWLPFGMDIKNETLHETITKNSFDYYKSAIEQKMFQGLKFAKVYNVKGDKPFVKSRLPAGTLEEAEEVEIEFGNGKFFAAYESTTILLDGYVFLNELFERAKQKGVVFVNRHFFTQEELLTLQERVIFNALGYGSKALFQDENMVPIRGQHLYLKPQKDVDYFLFAEKEKRVFALYPSQQKIASGFSYEVGQEEPFFNLTIYEQAKQELRDFFKDKVYPAKDEL